MTSNEQIAIAENSKINDAQKQFRLLISHFLEFEKNSASFEEKKKECQNIHDKAVEHFNLCEQSVTNSDLFDLHKNERWVHIKAETCLTSLYNIVECWKSIRALCNKLQVTPLSFPPTAFSAMQRLVAEHFPEEAASIRNFFLANELPTFGFDNPLPSGQRVDGYTNLEFDEHGIAKITNIKSEHAKDVLANYANIKTSSLVASGAIKDPHIVETARIAQDKGAQVPKPSYLRSLFTEIIISPVKLVTGLLGLLIGILLTYWLATNTNCQPFRRSAKQTTDFSEKLNELAKIGSANRDASRNYLHMAINLEKDKQYEKALENAVSAIHLDPNNAEAIYHAAHIELLSIKPPRLSEAHTLLVGHREVLNTDGKWLLGISYAQTKRFKESCEVFSALPDFLSIPYEIRLYALDAYLVCSFNINHDMFANVAQNVQIFVDKTLSEATGSGTVLRVRAGTTVKVPPIDLGTVLYLPSIKFRMGALSLALYNSRKENSGIPFSLTLIAEGFSSALMIYGDAQVYAIMSSVRQLCYHSDEIVERREEIREEIHKIEEQVNRYLSLNTATDPTKLEKLLDVQLQLKDCYVRLSPKGN